MRFVIATTIAMFVSQPLCSQPAERSASDSLSGYLRFEETSPFTCLLTYFPPLLIQHGIELKSFIRSKEFQKIRQRYGDVRAVDAIYIQSMKLTDNNTAMALLLAAVASFDHRSVGLRVPVFKLFFALSNESELDFLARVNNLPTHLFFDAPVSHAGDRDKLQHFFGSAFLSFVFESRDPADRVGTFIEEGEDAFIVDGVLDERDMRANHLGQEFGLALLGDNQHVPSEFLRFEVARSRNGANPAPENQSCSGEW